MNYLIFKSNDVIKIQMILKAFENRNIQFSLSEAGMGGVHGGLAFAQESHIYIQESDSKDAIEIIKALGF
tara:strand:- start:2094 stop:2303 length:210 start_codon:yes stop_codon:yes gene_type:complete